MASLGDIISVVAGLNAGLGIDVQNVYHLQVLETGGVDDDDLVDDMGEYLEDVYGVLNNTFANNVVYDLYKATNVTADVDLGTHPWPSLTQGGGAVNMLPTGDSGLVLGRTNTPGRVGKKYFGPFTSNALADGYWTAGVVATLADAMAEVWSPFISALANSYTPVILGRDDGVGRVVREATASAVPAYQRRRRPGTGS